MTYLTDRMDYIFFFYGLSFIFLSVVCFVLDRDKLQRLPWKWLGYFGLLHGASEWLDLLAFTFSDSPVFSAVRLLVMAASFCALLEFGRRVLTEVHGKVIPVWVHLPLLLLAASGFHYGFSGLNAGVRYALGLTGGLLACRAIWLEASGAEPELRRLLLSIAVGLGLYALAAGAIVPDSSLFPFRLPDYAGFSGLLGFPVQLLRGLLAAGIAVAAWSYSVTCLSGETFCARKTRAGWMFIFALFIFLAAGWFFADFLGTRAMSSLSRDSDNVQRVLFNGLRNSMHVGESTAASMSGAPGVLGALQKPGTSGVPGANDVLGRYCSSFGLSVCYVLNPRGVVVAATNRDTPQSFVGKDYGFRPYFKEAMAGKPSYYFAVGVTTGERGFYASHPVRYAGKVVGVAAVKINVDSLAADLRLFPYAFLVSPEGVIFISSRKELILRSLWPVSPEEVKRIAESGQYGKVDFDPVFKEKPHDKQELGLNGGRYFVSLDYFSQKGWALIGLNSTTPVRMARFTGVLLTFVLSLLLLAFLLVYVHTEAAREDTERLLRLKEDLNRSITKQRDEILILKGGIEQSPLGVVVTDTGGAIEYVNAAFTGMYGYTPADVLGKTPRVINSGDTPVAIYENLWKTLLKNKPWTGEIHNKAKDGSLLWVRAFVSPVCDSAGRLTHFMTLHKDVTLEKQLMADLLEAKRQADKANQAKSDFLASMSHEIRTPLNAIVGMSDLIDEAALNKDQRQYLDILRNASDSLLALINNILDISKIEAGKIDLEAVPFSLEEMVSKVSDLTAVRARAKGVEVNFKLEADVPVFLEGDATRLRQILLNVMGNAVKFVEKGWVALSVKKLKAEGESIELLFTVRDTGIGIPQNKMASVFEKFTQADSSTTRKYGGTGLGLPISKMLVELMGGKIWLESEPGTGTVFYFTVQVKAQKDNCAVYLPKVDIKELKGLRFLVLDDNLTNRIIIREIVQSWGAYAEGAADGKTALVKVAEEQAKGHPFNAIFVDYNMPGMDGYEFCTRLMGDANIQPKPAVTMATSDNIRFKQTDFTALGVKTHLLKPVRKQSVLDAALEMLARGRVDATAVLAAPAAGVYTREQVPELSLLIVDDSEDNRILMTSFLKGTKVKLDLAEDGLKGLDKFRAGKYDMVFLDIQMPVMDGFEVANKIRELEKAEGRVRTRVVALTAMAMREDVEKALAAGCDDFLTKPIRKNTFYAYLAELKR